MMHLQGYYYHYYYYYLILLRLFCVCVLVIAFRPLWSQWLGWLPDEAKFRDPIQDQDLLSKDAYAQSYDGLFPPLPVHGSPWIPEGVEGERSVEKRAEITGWTARSLPNPMTEPRACGMRAPSHLCDPDRYLSRGRGRVLRALAAVDSGPVYL